MNNKKTMYSVRKIKLRWHNITNKHMRHFEKAFLITLQNVLVFHFFKT